MNREKSKHDFDSSDHDLTSTSIASTSGGTDSSNVEFSNIFDALDLDSDPRRVYQAVLKLGDTSLEETAAVLKEYPEDELKMYLNLLTRLNYLEKYKLPEGIRYKVRGRIRNKSSLPDDIWKLLDK